jgi:Dolichyl-phosphate-mannose-protein mannosyltransferase
MRMETPRRLIDLAAALALFLGTLLLVAIPMPEYGLTWDEPYYFRAADLHVEWLSRFGRNLAAGRPGESLSEDAIEQAWHWDPYHVPHPPFPRILSGLSRALLSSAIERFTTYRLPTAVLFGLMVSITYVWLAKVFGRATALVGALLTLLTPHLFGHAYFAMTDMPLAALWWLTAWAFWKGLASWPWSVAAGALWGLALATKFPAILIPLPLLVWAHLYRRREYHNNVISMLLVGPAVMVATNPYLWHHPVARVFEFLSVSASRSIRPGTDFVIYFLGEYHRSDTLPWYYAGLMLVLALPETILALALVGAAIRMRSAEARQVRALFVLSAVAILASLLVPGAVLHDVTRLLLPVFPFVTGLGACGFGRLTQWIGDQLEGWAWGRGIAATRGKLLAAAGALALSVPAVDVALHAPYELSYFNRIVGGVQGAYDRGFEVTAMMEAFTPRFLAYLSHRVPPGAVVNASFGNQVFRYYQKHGRLRADIRISDGADYDYYVLLNRPSAYRRDPSLPVSDPTLYVDDAAFVASRPRLCHTWDPHGAPLILVFAREDRGCGRLRDGSAK